MMLRSRLAATLCLSAVLVFLQTVSADGPADNLPDQVRPVPPLGIEVPEADRKILEDGLAELESRLEVLRSREDASVQGLLPDIEIFSRAIRDGLAYRELFSEKDVADAKAVLREGLDRAQALLEGSAPWTMQTGLVVRGYRSRIDHTVQPYGLVIPESYPFSGKSQYRLDLWFHGRGERSSESVFIAERMNRTGRVEPRDTIVLHPYGRYSNAFKFAGEVDVLEALADARQRYRIDEDRIAVRGFSMGGAGCWQMAVHYPDLFFAANPGAGFSETPEFLKSFQQETLTPTWFERKLWQLYDCTGYSINLFNLPTIAYSGELDIQKQAADMMEQSLASEKIRLTHILGPETKHSIHPDSLAIIEAKLEQLARHGRSSLPSEIRFATYTLKYNRMFWLTLTALGEHWEPARVLGKLRPEANQVELNLQNVTAFRLQIPAGQSPFAVDAPIAVVIHDGPGNRQMVRALSPGTDGSWEAELFRDQGNWQFGQPAESQLRKKQHLQGPIDDAFMDKFIIVRPSEKARHAAVDRWAQSELEHLVNEWRRQFRGDAIVRFDREISPDDIASGNLILFGDPASNSVLASIIDKLPLKWSDQEIVIGSRHWNAADHAPIMIYPNPLNPNRYVVLNSGFTYREYEYLNNARQVPKLPDWAIVDLRTPPSSQWPGRIAAADFFDEHWQLKSEWSGKE